MDQNKLDKFVSFVIKNNAVIAAHPRTIERIKKIVDVHIEFRPCDFLREDWIYAITGLRVKLT